METRLEADAILGTAPRAEPRCRVRGAAAVARWIVPLLVVLLAGALRLPGSRSVGVRFDDEAAYAMDARLWHRLAALTLDGSVWSAVVRGDRAHVKARYHASGTDFGARYMKPAQGYTFLGAAAMFPLGDDPSTLHVLNAVLGTVSVLLVYLIGARLFDVWTGVFAALLLAISPYHVMYSRSAWAVASAVTFQLAGYWLWLRSSRDRGARRLASGAAFGCAVTCHYTSAVLVLPLLCVEAGKWLAGGGGRPRLRGAVTVAWLGAGVLAPFLVIEALMRAVRLALAGAGADVALPTFWDGFAHWSALVHSMEPGGGRWFRPDVVAALGECFAHWQGAPGLAVAVLGVGFALTRSGSARLVALPVVALLGLLGAQRFAVARALAPAVPWVALCVAFSARRAQACTAARLGSVRSRPELALCDASTLGAVVEPACGRSKNLDARRGGEVARAEVRGSVINEAACSGVWFRRFAPQLAAAVILVPYGVAAMASLAYWDAARSDVAVAARFMESLDGLVALPLDTTARSKYALYLGGENSGPLESGCQMGCAMTACLHHDPDAEPESASRAGAGRFLRERYYRLGTPEDVVHQLRGRGARWVVTDPQCWHYRDLERYPSDAVVAWCKEFDALLRDSCRLVAEFPHVRGALWEFASEGPGASVAAEMGEHDAGAIRVYDISSPRIARAGGFGPDHPSPSVHP